MCPENAMKAEMCNGSRLSVRRDGQTEAIRRGKRVNAPGSQNLLMAAPVPEVWRTSSEPMVSVIVPLGQRRGEPQGFNRPIAAGFRDHHCVRWHAGQQHESGGRHRQGAISLVHPCRYGSSARSHPGPSEPAAQGTTLSSISTYVSMVGCSCGLTELAVHFRSRVLGLPFGDQALCVSRQTFSALGGYDERAIHGEDHLLVRKAHRAGLSVEPVGATLVTKRAEVSPKRLVTHNLAATTADSPADGVQPL